MVALARPEDRIALIAIERNRARCLNTAAIGAPPGFLPHYLEMFRRVAALVPLPDVRFALNLMDEARVIVLPDRGPITHPQGDGYLRLVEARATRPDAARHPAIFS